MEIYAEHNNSSASFRRKGAKLKRETDRTGLLNKQYSPRSYQNGFLPIFLLLRQQRSSESESANQLFNSEENALW